MADKLIYLKQVIDLVIAENSETHKKKLWSLIRVLASNEMGEFNEKESSRIINEIHELCYEQTIRMQGISLYSCFPYKSQVSKLAEDYIEMEHCRRRDDFERFCFAMYQQLENMVNFLADHYRLWERASNDRFTKIYSFSGGSKKGERYGLMLGNILKYIEEKDRPKANEILNQYFKRPADKLTFKEKCKLVIYYIYFDTIVKDKQEWDNIFNTASDLYLVRNRNHRGEILNAQVEASYKNIYENRYRYYLTFTGFLADFIQKVCVHYDNRVTLMQPN